MKKYISVFILFLLCVLCLASCAPTTQTQAATINVSEIEALPEEVTGDFGCTVTYTPGKELYASVQNNTEFILYSGQGDGLLYCREDGEWTKMEPSEPVMIDLISSYTLPGGINENASFSAAGFYKPELEAGEYKLVFSVRLEGDREEEQWKFDLEIPFSVV